MILSVKQKLHLSQKEKNKSRVSNKIIMRGHSLPPRRRPKARQLLRIPKQRPAAPGEIQAEPRITTSRPESLSKMKTRQHTSLLYAILMSCTSTCLSYERSPILIYRQMPVLWTHLSWSTAHMPILWTPIYPYLRPKCPSNPIIHSFSTYEHFSSTLHLIFSIPSSLIYLTTKSVPTVSSLDIPSIHSLTHFPLSSHSLRKDTAIFSPFLGVPLPHTPIFVLIFNSFLPNAGLLS